MPPRTVTNRSRRDREARTQSRPRLVRVLDCDHPRAPGALHELEGLDEVLLGRTDAVSVQREGRTLVLGVADARMSSRHARLYRESGQWLVEDRGSRNGTFVGGTRVDRVGLHDGAVLELGRHLFLFVIGDRPAPAPDVPATSLRPVLPGVVTFSTDFEAPLEAAARLARSPTNVILHGETGTGKEVLARGIHVASGRRGAFTAVNCAALPPTLIESELFGHKKGAFSGAIDDRLGLVRASDGGTLFLDEVGDLPPVTQTALLRVLQEREVLPIGATKPTPVDLRVLAASHRDLETEAAAGRLREDLLARLAGFTIELPPLRERREDLGLLVAALVERLAPDRPALRLAPEVGLALLTHDWPRNVRELEQTLGAAIALAVDNVIELEHVPRLRTARPGEPARPGTLDDGEDLAPSEVRRRDELRALLAEHAGNVAAVARAMGVARMQIHRWIERYRLELTDFRRR